MYHRSAIKKVTSGNKRVYMTYRSKPKWFVDYSICMRFKCENKIEMKEKDIWWEICAMNFS